MLLPYAAVEFTRDGRIAREEQADAAVALASGGAAGAGGPTDLLLIAHGWNNDITAAENMFERLTDHLAAELGSHRKRHVVVIGLLWPSIRWADEDDLAGGGASADPEGALDNAIGQAVEDPPASAALRAVAGALDGSDARREFVTVLRELLPERAGDEEDPVPASLRKGDIEELFAAAAEAEFLAEEEADVTTIPGPPGTFPDLLTGTGTSATGFEAVSPLVLARRLLNLTTYYTMKDRAGKVGANGAATLIGRLHRGAPEVRIHLAGHSFGARVISAAATAIDSPIASMTLLQGAFSHFGFTEDYDGKGRDGAFRKVITGGHLQGPIIITHTRNDAAVRTAYALASRIARQSGSAVGDRNDPYGGIGANGAVAPGEADDTVALQDVDETYAFRPGHLYNLQSDKFIAGHGSVTGKQVAHALLGAMISGGLL